MGKTAFVAASHLCWFSTNYKDKTVKEVIAINPQYIRWCIDNLKHLKFADQIKRNVNKQLSQVK